jgi:acyl-CoA synthetase (AMP-forming)/AMP-acid ligase II
VLEGRPATIGGLIARSVSQRPSAEAIATLAETLTYSELDARVSALARALVANGAGKGTRIALMAPDGVLWASAFLAATRIGAIVAAVSTLATAPELAHVLRHSDAQMLIGVRKFLRHDYAERLAAALPSLAHHREGPLYLPEAPYLRSIWLDDADGLAWAAPHAALFDRPGPDARLLAAIEAEVAPSDEAVIIYTSGSSSLPKAVVHTQCTASQQSQVLAEHFLMSPSDRLMPLLPLFWVGGLTMLLEVLLTGGTLVYPRTPAQEDVLAALEGLKVNRINTWGPQLEKLRQAVAARGIDPNTIGGLAPQRTPQGEAIPLERTFNMLGMTESFGPHSSEPMGTVVPEERRGASGRATNDYERRIVDPETGEVLGPGRSGELQIRRGALMRGFYKVDPDRVFTPDGFYPTGDSARMDEDGYLYFEGRRGDMLKTAGANVSRLEVEAALRTLPEVAQPIVVGLPDPDAGQIVVAAVVPAEGRHPTEESLKAALRNLVSSYKVPRRIVLISAEEVPWTPSNKIKLGEVAAMIGERIGAKGRAKAG